MFKTRQQTFPAVAWAAGGVVPIDLTSVYKKRMVEAVYMLCEAAVTTAAVGGACTVADMLAAFGINIQYRGQDQSLARFITNRSLEEQMITAILAKGYNLNPGNFAAAGAGAVGVYRGIAIPVYPCVNYTRKNPLEGGQASEIFERSHFDWTFGPLPGALGVGGAFVGTVRPLIIYTDNENQYVNPVTEYISEHRTVQNEIAVNAGVYENIGITTLPAFGLTVTDILSWQNGEDRFLINETRRTLVAKDISCLDVPSYVPAFATQPIPLFSNSGRDSEDSRRLTIGISDDYRTNFTVAALTDSWLHKEMIYPVKTPANIDYLRRLLEKPNASFQPVTPFDSDYVQHKVIG